MVAAGEGTQAVGAGITLRTGGIFDQIGGTAGVPLIVSTIVTAIGGLILNKRRNSTRAKALAETISMVKADGS